LRHVRFHRPIARAQRPLLSERGRGRTRGLDKGVAQTTLEFKISLVRSITPATGVIRAEGLVLNRGRRIGTAEGRITDPNGRLLAHGTTTCLIFDN
jgi:uncharacterized protein (TIGR00369 family)